MDPFKQTTDQQRRDFGIVTEIGVRKVTRLLYLQDCRLTSVNRHRLPVTLLASRIALAQVLVVASSW